MYASQQGSRAPAARLRATARVQLAPQYARASRGISPPQLGCVPPSASSQPPTPQPYHHPPRPGTPLPRNELKAHPGCLGHSLRLPPSPPPPTFETQSAAPPAEFLAGAVGASGCGGRAPPRTPAAAAAVSVQSAPQVREPAGVSCPRSPAACYRQVAFTDHRRPRRATLRANWVQPRGAEHPVRTVAAAQAAAARPAARGDGAQRALVRVEAAQVCLRLASRRRWR